ncbi:MiaB/RimO family radical SAM methylthiotransferase [bacterium]|nr:MiaB/RimO family radical SAM methylthiotransferase [bacterium]
MQPRFTFFNRVFGCQMNVADIDDISTRLAAAGGWRVEKAEDADLVLVNTCTVRQKAEDKAMSFLGGLKHAGHSHDTGARRLRPRKKDGATGPFHTLTGGGGSSNGKKPFIVAMGCVVPGSRKKIAKTHSHVDLLINYSDPDVVLAELTASFPPLREQAWDDLYRPQIDPSICQQSFITAIRGCNHRCSFCIVPWARGPQRDVPLGEIVAQAQAYEQAGAPDITVLGQSIMAYGKASKEEHPSFLDLMLTLLAETSFPWISYMTSLVCDLTDEICEQVIANPRIAPLLHLPVQSGSDKVLGDMRRKYDTARYRRMVAKAREVRPDLYLTTDLLVGFPSESEEDFELTLDLVEEIGFDDAFMFAYSERPGTHSARHFPDLISREEKVGRLSRLIDKQRSISAMRNRRYIGQVLPVIIEKHTEEGALARTAFNKPVSIGRTPRGAGGVNLVPSPTGSYTSVRITGSKVSSFMGEETGGNHLSG